MCVLKYNVEIIEKFVTLSSVTRVVEFYPDVADMGKTTIAHIMCVA